jgi:DNA-binding transcriptional ArsR family regulator
MMTEKQLIVKYEAERVALATAMAIDATRMAALVDLLASLRVMTGEAPTPKVTRKGAGAATGTKALILDVLAGGARYSAKGLADAVQVKPAAVVKHLATLVEAGDVRREGKSRATRYRIS